MSGALDPLLRELLADRPISDLGPVTPDIAAAARAGSVSSLLSGVAAREGCEILPEAQFSLAAVQMADQARQTAMASALAELAGIFGPAKVPIRIFKGPAIAATVYDNPNERASSDIDLMMSPAEFESVRAGMVDAGYLAGAVADAVHELNEQGRPVHEVLAEVGSAAVDIHFNCYSLLAPLRNPDLVLDHFIPAILFGDVECLLPDPTLALVIAAINLTRDGGRALNSAGDIARLLQRTETNWATFERLTSTEGLHRIAETAVQATIEDLQLAVTTPIRVTGRGRPYWAPKLGEGNEHLRARRRSIWLSLRRPVRFLPRSIYYTVRHLVPFGPMLQIMGAKDRERSLPGALGYIEGRIERLRDRDLDRSGADNRAK